MAYFAIPTRDSTFLLLANAAPRLPRSSCITSPSSRPLLDAPLIRSIKLHSSNLFGASISSNYITRGRKIIASVESNVTVEELAVEAESQEKIVSEESVPEVAAAAESSGAPVKRLQRTNTLQRRAGPSRVITVQKEQLVPGAVFTGKVRAVQNYGAFVDIGAFTDGLVHISELSSNYVKEVNDVVSLGQEVTVRVIEMDERAGRIALTMRDKESEAEQQTSSGGDLSLGASSQEDGSGKPQNRGKIAGRGSANSRSSSDDKRKVTKLKKGQELKGTVKNIIRNGAFIEFPDGEEGFLRGSEISEGGENVAVDTLLTVGQEVTVRVLKIERGKAALTMKPQVDMKSINKAINNNEEGGALNPFEAFFRSANLIPEVPAAEDIKAEKSEIEEESVEEPVISDTVMIADVESTSDAEQAEEKIPASEETIEDPVATPDVLSTLSDEQVKIPALENNTEDPVGSPDVLSNLLDEQLKMGLAETVQEIEELAKTGTEDIEIGNKVEAAVQKRVEEAPAAIADEIPKVNAPTLESSEETESETESAPDANVAPMEASTPESTSTITDETPEETSESSFSQTAAEVAVPEIPMAESIPEETLEPTLTLDSVAPTTTDAVPSMAPEPVIEAPSVETSKAISPASGPTAAQVKQLRETTGAGMMECKKALVACNSDIVKASEYLRKKGLASAEKKASRIAAEGRVGSYVHDGRMGVLIEINCETDFVSRGTQFKELVADMGMQVVACPDVQYVSVDDVPSDFVQKEKEIESGKEDLANKPPQIREKIVEGRITKRLAELALLEQPYIRDDKILVKDLVKQTTAQLGEKTQVRRFVRFNLGEGLQKKSVDFAAEVAAQTAAKTDVKSVTETPQVEEPKKEDDTPKVAVSAAKVKELREVTGAGMMDCKKALAACENDVQKATEFLRKKGLASAEKKAGRIASEGLIGSYIHDGRIGVLVEVNSETDFVARSAQFKELVANIAMQVAACPQVQYATVDEIPASIVEKEKEIEAGKEDLATKPEAVRSKIVEGRVSKTLNELVLMEQPYIREDKILVKEYIKQTIAALGENIQVRRFARFNLGEGIEKRSTDFAAEVAAQTGAKV